MLSTAAARAGVTLLVGGVLAAKGWLVGAVRAGLSGVLAVGNPAVVGPDWVGADWVGVGVSDLGGDLGGAATGVVFGAEAVDCTGVAGTALFGSLGVEDALIGGESVWGWLPVSRAVFQVYQPPTRATSTSTVSKIRISGESLTGAFTSCLRWWVPPVPAQLPALCWAQRGPRRQGPPRRAAPHPDQRCRPSC